MTHGSFAIVLLLGVALGVALLGNELLHQGSPNGPTRRLTVLSLVLFVAFVLAVVGRFVALA